MDPTRAAIIADLREKLTRMAPLREAAPPLPSGHRLLDEHIGGWPRPGVSVITGKPGTGRLLLLLPTLQHLTTRGQRVAIVDPLQWLHPPGLSGVDLEQVLLVRPGVERTLWAAEQLLSTGGLPIVVLLDVGKLGRAGRRLLTAAEQGNAACLVVQETRDPHLPASLCLEILPRNPKGVQVVVHRDRHGRRLGPLHIA